MIRGIVFDLDGTLVDSYGAIAESLNHARASFELPPLPLDHVRRVVGRGLESLIAEQVGPQRVDRGVELFRERYAEVYAERTTVLPEVEATLDGLTRAGLRLSVASNKPARFSRPILERLALAAKFDTIEGPDTVGATKPEPAMLWRCLEVMGVPASAGVYVGDMVLDVETAERAGVPVVLVPGGSSDLASLVATGRRVVGRFADLVPLLSGSGSCPSAEPGV